jgi:hypothetical protein
MHAEIAISNSVTLEKRVDLVLVGQPFPVECYRSITTRSLKEQP